MSFTVNQVVNSAFATDPTTLSITIPAGHSVVVLASTNSAGPPAGTCTDNGAGGANTYIGANGCLGGGGTSWIQFFYSLNIANAITSVTFTTGAGGNSNFSVWDVTATGIISYEDSAGIHYNFTMPATTDGATSGLLALTKPSGLIFGSMETGSGATITEGTGFTQDGNFASHWMTEHKTVSAAAEATFTQTAAGGFGGVTGLMLGEVSGLPAFPFSRVNHVRRSNYGI